MAILERWQFVEFSNVGSFMLSTTACGFVMTCDSPIQLNEQLIKGHSGVGLVIVYNSGPTYSIQLINEHNTRSMLSGSS